MELKESKHPKPTSDEDALTVELRNEFALLNKILELREISKDASKKKLNRKAARAAIKEAKKASKKTPSNTIKAPPKSPPKAIAPGGEWVNKFCWRCKSKFSVHTKWDKPPSLCRPCTKDLDETYLPSGPDHSTPFSKVHFVSGGAPGSGKRR
jgi:hypothetical protein